MASEAKGLAVLREAGFVAEAFAEVLDEIQPGFSVQFEAIQNGSTVLWDRSDFVLANLAAGPVQKVQILIQSHRQAAFVAGSTSRRLLTHLLSRRFQSYRSKPSGLIAVLNSIVILTPIRATVAHLPRRGVVRWLTCAC